MRWSWVIGVVGVLAGSGCSQVGTADVNNAIRSCLADNGKWDDMAQGGDCGQIRAALVESVVTDASNAEIAEKISYPDLATALVAVPEFYPSMGAQIEPADVADHVNTSAVADEIADGLLQDGVTENGFYAALASQVNPSSLASEIVGGTSFVEDVADDLAEALTVDGSALYTGLASSLLDADHAETFAMAVVSYNANFYAELAKSLDENVPDLYTNLLDADDGTFASAVATNVALPDLAAEIAGLTAEELATLTDGVADGLAAEHVSELMADSDLRVAVKDALAVDPDFIGDVASAAEPALSADGSALRTGLLADLDTDALFQSSVASLVLATLDGAAVVGKVDEYIASSGAFPWAAEVLGVVDGADYQTGADVDATLAGFTFPAAWRTQVDTEVGSIMGDLVDLVAAGAVEFDAGEDLLTFDAVNVRIVNGAGSTDVSNGLGNLVIGYNEDTLSNTRTGSHNVVLGSENRYSGAGGIVLGYSNDLASPFGGLVSGNWNTVSGEAAAAIGGQRNDVTGSYAVAVAGADNETFGSESATMAGNDLHASGSASVLIGGASNVTYGAYSTITGGGTNETYNWGTVVTGGYGNEAGNSSDPTGDWNYSVVVGGAGNIAAGYEGVVVSGYETTLGSSTRRAVLCGKTGSWTNNSTDGHVYACGDWP